MNSESGLCTQILSRNRLVEHVGFRQFQETNTLCWTSGPMSSFRRLEQDVPGKSALPSPASAPERRAPWARNTGTGGTRQSQKQLALDKVSAYLYLAQGKTNDIRGGVRKYKV